MLINECEHCYEAHKAINSQNLYTFPHFSILLAYQYTEESYRYNEDHFIIAFIINYFYQKYDINLRTCTHILH